MAYLDDHPNPHQRQQRERRDTPTGLIVVHTAESALDTIGEDTGAEGVARFISQRTTPGSYHRIADSDSVVAVARFEMTTYGDGTGSNDIAIHVSFACRAADWPRMSTERRRAFIENGARAAADAAKWLREHHGITVPAKRISRADSERRRPGFISHAERDPARRTDPGSAFPWDLFIELFESLMEDDMTPEQAKQLNDIHQWLSAGGVVRKKLNGLRERAVEIRQNSRAGNRTVQQLRSDVEELTELVEQLSVEAGDGGPRS